MHLNQRCLYLARQRLVAQVVSILYRPKWQGLAIYRILGGRMLFLSQGQSQDLLGKPV